MELIILAVSFFGFLVIGVPVAFAIGLSALCTILYEGLPVAVIFQQMMSGMNIFSFLAIPFFVFSGELMLHGGVADKIKRCLKRRAVAEPVIGHAKNDSLLGRNWLKGRTGDRCNTLLAAAGFNLRQVLRFLKRCKYFLRAFFSALLTVFDLLPLTQATL